MSFTEKSKYNNYYHRYYMNAEDFKIHYMYLTKFRNVTNMLVLLFVLGGLEHP